MDILLTVVSGILMLTFFVVIHEAGHYFVAKKCGIAVQEFSIGFGPKIVSFQSKETKISIRIILFGGFVKFAGDDDEPENNSFLNASIKKRVYTVLAGPLMNIFAAFVLAVIFLCVFGDMVPCISGILPGSNAELYGLEIGDTVLMMNGVDIKMSVDLQTALNAAHGDSMDIVVSRGGEILSFEIPFSVYDGQPQKIGVSEFTFQRVTYDIFTSIGLAFKWLWMLIQELFGVLGGLVTTGEGFSDLTGPVGTISIIGDVVKTGWENILRLASLISINLAVINLLPMPSLDGGKVVLYAIEAARKKPVSYKVEGILSFVGFMVLIGFAVIITFKDIFWLAGG